MATTAPSTAVGFVQRRLGAPYWRLWTAAVVSRFGDALRGPALSLLAAAVTRDPRGVAAVVVAGQLAPLLFSLVGGVYADRWDRRRTMAAVDGARAVLVAAFAVLVATGHAGVPALAACAFALAALGTLFDASAFALLPALIPSDRLPTANGRLQAGTAVAGGILGGPAAGILFSVAALLPFAIDAASFAIAALLALTLPATLGIAAKPTRGVSESRRNRQSVWRESGEGLRWLWREPTLRLITLFTALTNLAIAGLIAVLVLFALDVLHVPEKAYGLFMSGAVLGALVGALLAGPLASRLGVLSTLRWVLLVETLALTGLAVVRQPVLGALALATFSAGTALWNTLSSSYGQQKVPPDILGRVGSAQRMAGLVTAPIGAILAGFAADIYGLPSVAYGAAALLALLTAMSWPVLAPQREPRDQPTTDGPPGRPASRR